jgi:hypothetical protein
VDAKSKGKNVVRLKGRDDLSDKAGRLSLAFGGAILKALYKSFSAAATDKAAAAKVLKEFQETAGKLNSSESEFNKRARPANGKLSALNNLRNAAQLKAVREFEIAKREMEGFKGGRLIIRLATRAFRSAAPQQPRPPSPQ